MPASRTRYWRQLAFCLALFLSPFTVAARLGHADDDLNATSLSIAPQDVAFFSASVNLRDAWLDLAQSKFVTRLRSVPFIQELEEEFERQWDNPEGQLAQAKGMLQNPNVQNLLKLGQDMFDEETFVYGGDDWSASLNGLARMQNEMASRMGQGAEAMQQYFAELDKEAVDEIRIPTTVMGFRLSNPEAAQIQLDALEGILRLGGSQVPQAKPFLQRLKRTDFEDGQTLAITLDTDLIPIEAIPDAEAREVAEKVVELLAGRSLTFGLGVKGNLLLMAIGESPTVVEDVGSSEQTLIDHAALSVLKEASTTNLRSIAYVSKAFKESSWNVNFGQYFQRMVSQFSMAASSEGDRMPDLSEWTEELREDAKWMDEQVMKLAPEFGASLSWSRAIEGGTEGFGYDWTQSNLENDAPIAVTSYAGSNPLLLLAFKQREAPDLSELAEQLFKKIPGHVERLVTLMEDEADERERILKVLDQTWPIVGEAFEICRDKLGPSLAGNETLFSMSASWTTSVMPPNLPQPERALPLPEFGGVCKLADRALFIEGCDQLYQLADKIVDLIRENDPDAIPVDYSVPRPREATVKGATKYYYSEFSAAVPIEGFEPQLLVGDDAIVFGYSDRQVRDLYNSRPLEVGPAWLTAETPIAAVSYVDFAGMVDAVRPWLAYGLAQTGRAMDEPLADQPGPIPTGNDVLQIWDCFRSAGIATGTATAGDDSGATVSHWVWVDE